MFAKRVGGRWRTLGSAKTNAAGSARVRTSFASAGKVAIRAVATAFGGDPIRTATSSIRVIQPRPLQVTAPADVGAGAVFDVQVALTADKFALRGVTLALTAPADGQQVKPPSTWRVDATTHTAKLSVGSLAKGKTRKLPLRWQAPTGAGALDFTIVLKGKAVHGSAVAVKQTMHRRVKVDDTSGGGFSFDDNLVTTGQSRTVHAAGYYRSCVTQVAGAAIPTFTQALSAIDDLTASGTGTDAWKQLDLEHHPERADDVAGVAIGAHDPAGALAAVIQGWRDTPNDGVYLNDAAAFANSLRHPGWAIALEQRAGELDLNGRNGVAYAAVRLANLGHAYAMMGDWAQGKTYLTQAVALQSDSVQLQQELAAISFCAGDPPGAAAAFGKSLRPPGSPVDDITTGSGSSATHQIGASKLWDLSHATAPVVELPPVPATPADLIAERGQQRGDGFWVDEYWRLHDRSNDLFNQAGLLRGQLNAEDLQPVERQQINDILQHLVAEPSIERLAKAALAARPGSPCHGTNDAVFCGGQDSNRDCTLNQQAFDTWHVDMNGWRNAIGAYVAEVWRVDSGLRAQLGDETAWQLAGVLVESNLTSWALGYVQQVWYASNAMPSYDNDSNPCPWATATPTQPTPEPTKVTGTDPVACPADSLKARVAVAIEGEIGVEGEGAGWSIKQSCASTDYELDANVFPFLAGFVKSSANTDGSGVTMFAGAKTQISGGGQSSSFESSLYVTFDGNGHITDFGWDVGPEVEEGIGPIKFTAYSDHCRISFMSLFTDTPAT